MAGEYPKSFVFTGWHPQCFCYVTPILGDEDEIAKITDAFVNGEEYEPQFEQLEEYPKGFQNWVKDRKKQIEKSIKQGKEPYFIKDNKKVIEEIIDSKNRMQVKLLNSSSNSLDYNRASDLKIINLELGNKSSISNQEVIGIINEIDKTNPELFKGRLKEVKIINTKKGFMAFDRTSGVLNISDNAFTTLNDGEFAPLKELKGAFAKIATRKKKAILSFNQEYALECLWHEIRHASALGWKDISNKTAELTNTMELINQFCARKSYKKLVQSLGGKTAHEKKIMEKGYGYNNSIQNFCFLLKEINVSQKSAYTHFKDIIINKPYENIHGELIKFISEKGKIRKEEVYGLVDRFGYLHKEFKLFYKSMNA